MIYILNICFLSLDLRKSTKNFTLRAKYMVLWYLFFNLEYQFDRLFLLECNGNYETWINNGNIDSGP